MCTLTVENISNANLESVSATAVFLNDHEIVGMSLAERAWVVSFEPGQIFALSAQGMDIPEFTEVAVTFKSGSSQANTLEHRDDRK